MYKPPSHRSCRCGECNAEMRFSSLGRHFQDCHDGRPAIEARQQTLESVWDKANEEALEKQRQKQIESEKEQELLNATLELERTFNLEREQHEREGLERREREEKEEKEKVERERLERLEAEAQANALEMEQQQEDLEKEKEKEKAKEESKRMAEIQRMDSDCFAMDEDSTFDDIVSQMNLESMECQQSEPSTSQFPRNSSHFVSTSANLESSGVTGQTGRKKSRMEFEREDSSYGPFGQSGGSQYVASAPTGTQNVEAFTQQIQDKLDEKFRELAKKLDDFFISPPGNANPPYSSGGAGNQPLSLSSHRDNHSSCSSVKSNVSTATPSINENTKTLIRNSKSVSNIMSLAPEFSYFFESELMEVTDDPSGLNCKTCEKAAGKSGKIMYNFEKGTAFHGSKQPQEFLNLKRKVISHLESSSHNENAKTLEKAHLEKKKLQPRNEKVGMVLGRNAYTALKVHGSQQSYELEVATDHAKGIDIGEMNHSRKFAAEMTGHFYNTLKSQMMNHLEKEVPGTEKPTPFSIVADKMTPNRDTKQIIGLMAYVDSKFQDLFYDLATVTQHTGAGIAKAIHNSLTENFTQEEINERLVGGAFDGQYHLLNVPDKLLDQMGVCPENRDWYSFSWDPAHILELAADDAKKKVKKGEPDNRWVHRTEKIIANCNKQIGYGKSYQEIRELSEGQSRKPTSFSDTRFATYSANSLKNFSVNYPYIYDRLNRLQMDDLDHINNSNFTLRLAGLTDVCSEIGKLSRKIQKPDIYTWQVDSSIEKRLKILDEMAESIDKTVDTNTTIDRTIPVDIQIQSPGLQSESSQSQSSNRDSATAPQIHEKFNHLKSAIQELDTEGTFKGKPVLDKQHAPTKIRSQTRDQTYNTADNTQVIDRVRKDLAQYIRTFSKNLRSRYSEAALRTPASKLAGDIFSMDRILAEPQFPNEHGMELENSWLESLEKYSDLAKSVGAIPQDKSMGELTKQYQEFRKIVKNKSEDTKFKDKNGKILENKIYCDLLSDKNQLQNCRDVGQLLCGATLRTQCEAVAEGMGSVVTNHVRNRGSLGETKLKQESFLAWNGPPPTTASDPLLRQSLDAKFNGRDKWNFVRRTERKDRLKAIDASIVVDRINQNKGRIPFHDSDSDSERV